MRRRKGMIMRRIFKKIAAVATAATMMMSMGLTAFAAAGDSSAHEAALYKAGTFGTGSDAKSMGDGAIGDATVVDNGDGTYTVTVGLVEDFKAYGIKSNMKSVTVEGQPAVMIDQNRNGKYDAFQFTRGELTYPQKISTSFTIKALIMPIDATGDLVIF